MIVDAIIESRLIFTDNIANFTGMASRKIDTDVLVFSPCSGVNPKLSPLRLSGSYHNLPMATTGNR